MHEATQRALLRDDWPAQEPAAGVRGRFIEDLVEPLYCSVRLRVGPVSTEQANLAVASALRALGMQRVPVSRPRKTPFHRDAPEYDDVPLACSVALPRVR